MKYLFNTEMRGTTKFQLSSMTILPVPPNALIIFYKSRHIQPDKGYHESLEIQGIVRIDFGSLMKVCMDRIDLSTIYSRYRYPHLDQENWRGPSMCKGSIYLQKISH